MRSQAGETTVLEGLLRNKEGQSCRPVLARQRGVGGRSRPSPHGTVDSLSCPLCKCTATRRDSRTRVFSQGRCDTQRRKDQRDTTLPPHPDQAHSPLPTAFLTPTPILPLPAVESVNRMEAKRLYLPRAQKEVWSRAARRSPALGASPSPQF